MPKKNSNLTLESTSTDSHFALAADADFAALIAPLGTLPGGPYDYAFVSTSANAAGNIKIGGTLAPLDGIIATGNGKDNIDLSASTGANLVIAGNGVDTVIGGAGADNISGDNGKDTLGGGAGNDMIDGGSAKDSITGGTDTGVFTVTVVPNPIDPTLPPTTMTTFTVGDVLTGGEAKDTFHYTFGDGVDEITDFRVGQDKIVFHGIDETDLVELSGIPGSTSLVIGISLLGVVQANSAIQVDGVDSLDQLLNSHSLLFV